MRLAVSLLALAAAVPALADDVTTQAPVAAVTVYPDGATLTRRAEVELPAGASRVFLPYAGLDDLSALPRILTSEGVSIGAVGFRRAMPVAREELFTQAQADLWGEIEWLKGEIDGAEDARASAAAAVRALEARLAFLAKVAPGEATTADSIVALAAAVADEVEAAETGLVEARAALRPLDARLDDLGQDLAEAQAAFARLSPPGEVNDMLTVELEVAEAGPVSLEITEFAGAAWWEMDYDIDLDRETGTLDVDRKLVVMQETGEIWGDVELTLSTARPGETVGPAPVFPDQARIDDPQGLKRGGVGSLAMEEADMALAPAPMVEPEIAVAAAQFDGLSLTYIYPTPVTIASAEASELALDTLALAAEPMVWASPRRDQTAFTVARFTNTTDEPILPGMANFLRDGHLVGREPVAMIPAGAETELGFGPVEGIRLETIFERNAEGDSGIITRSNTREQIITFTVENLTDEAQEVRAFFPLTFSEQEDLRVRVSTSPAPDETDVERKRGVSAWDLSLAPGDTAEVEILVQLDWPEGMELYWRP